MCIIMFMKHSDAQVITAIGSSRICYGTFSSIPVTVQNMTVVDSLQLVLSFQDNSIEYGSYFALHQQMAGGSFNVSSVSNSIKITWHRKNAANLINDTLVWLYFKGLSGTTDLTWDTFQSFYHNASAGMLPANYTNGSAKVSTKLGFLLTEIDQTCTTSCSANYMVNVKGGERPYQYTWNGQPGRFDSIQTNLCSGSNVILVKDAWGCDLDSLFYIKGLPGANIKLKMEKDSVLYIQNPSITFSFDEISPTHIVEPPLWEFGDGDTARSFNPTHVYANAIANKEGAYNMILHIQNENGCDTLIEKRIPIKEAKLIIPNVMTPNADDVNDIFGIANFEKQQTGAKGVDMLIKNEFQRMEVYIFDRWGRRVFIDTNYQNNWNADGMPDGVYYYELKTVGFYKTDQYKGSITILGSSIKR